MSRNQLVVQSFGYLHREVPSEGVDLAVDVRYSLFNPARDPAFRELTGKDRRVREHVLATPGVEGLLLGVWSTALSLVETARAHGRLVRVAWGCAGGRHRSVVLADVLAEYARTAGVEVEVTHRDLHRPVVQ